MELMEQMGQMDHSEAVNLMAAERYLLGELPADLRDAFEEHLFDCPECAFDIRAGVAFVDEARVQLPGLAATQAESAPQTVTNAPDRPATEPRRRKWSGWWGSTFSTPAFAAPVFATLLLVIGYQNLVTYPALRTEATEPRLLSSVTLHADVRGARTVVTADRKQGVLLKIDLPGQEGQTVYSFYTVDLYNPQGKLAWTRNITPAAAEADSETLSVALPGEGIETGGYSLVISGVNASGQRSEVERQSFDIQFHD
jgi:anti-sigma-K factor RskA